MGTRIAYLAATFLGGVLLGAMGTVGHEVTFDTFGHEVPWGIAFGLIGVAAYLVGVRLLAGGRMATVAAAIGVILPIAVLSLQGPGGSVLVQAGTLGEVWEYAPAVVALLVVAWPSLPVRAARPDQA